jgi:osmotically-inducible protein OsmY
MNQKYDSDDHSRYSGPEYLDRLSLSDAYHKKFRREDALIYDEVYEALLNASEVDASGIEIHVEDGVVTLTGQVESRPMKKEAELCLEHISDIEDVFNLLTLSQFTDVGGEGLIKNQARL